MLTNDELIQLFLKYEEKNAEKDEVIAGLRRKINKCWELRVKQEAVIAARDLTIKQLKDSIDTESNKDVE